MRTKTRGGAATEQDRETLFGSNAMARLAANGGDTSALRTNDLLSDEEWRQIDDQVIPPAEERLVIVSDLEEAGLIHEVDGLGVLETEFEDRSDVSAAEQTMSGASQGDEDLPETGTQIRPLPVTFKDFRIKARQLMASRNRGEGLDVSGGSAAGRSVAEKLEDTVFNGGDVTLSGNGLPGLTDFSARSTFTISTAWDSLTDLTNILSDVLDMYQDAEDDNYTGPFNLYIPGNYAAVMFDDFKAESDVTVMERIEDIPVINEVRIADQLADDNVVLVQMTSNVIDLAVAQRIDTIEWSAGDEMEQYFKVLAAMAPRVKQDFNSNTGIVHGSV